MLATLTPHEIKHLTVVQLRKVVQLNRANFILGYESWDRYDSIITSSFARSASFAFLSSPALDSSLYCMHREQPLYNVLGIYFEL